MKKVLFFGTTYIYGGIGHLIFDIINTLDKNKFKVDVMYYDYPSDEEMELLKKVGISFIKVGKYSRNPIEFVKTIRKHFSETHYDIIHIHANTSASILYAFPLFHNDNTKIVYHSHTDKTTGLFNIIAHTLFKGLMNRYSDVKIAISQQAAKHMYGKKYKEAIFLRNGINEELYSFNLSERTRLRAELGLNDKIIIGNVGRIEYPKNNLFMLDVFKKVLETKANAVFVMIGCGDDEQQVKAHSVELGISEKVFLLGPSNEAYKYYNMFDCFLFPSLHEGLGIVAIEAQANGLPVVASSSVPKETKISNIIKYLSLDEDIQEWANAVNNYLDMDINRIEYKNCIRESHFSIYDATYELERIYEK